MEESAEGGERHRPVMERKGHPHTAARSFQFLKDIFVILISGTFLDHARNGSGLGRDFLSVGVEDG